MHWRGTIEGYHVLQRWRRIGESGKLLGVDEGRKRVIGIMAAILTSLHMQTADDLFGGPQGSPRTEKLIAASIQWAELIMRKIDNVFEE
jgi:hypothetical protein